MKLFSRKGSDKRNAGTEPEPLDPVAVTLAIWLGLIVGVTGIGRLALNAAQIAAASRQAVPPGNVPRVPSMRAFGFGT